MEGPVLSDKDQFPTEEIIFSHIGKTRKLWESFFEYIHTSHPDLEVNWRYYKDGKSWLMKVTRKSKTIFWLSVIKGSFRTTFYFTDRAEKSILDSSLSDELKKSFTDGKKYNKIRGITVVFKRLKDVEYAETLINIKLNVK